MQRVGTWLTDFIRYHVLIRVFHGDVDAWISIAEKRCDPDITFLRWLKRRIREDKSLLGQIHETVEQSGLWPKVVKAPAAPDTRPH